MEMAGPADGKPAVQLRARGTLTQAESSTGLTRGHPPPPLPPPPGGEGANSTCLWDSCNIHTSGERAWRDLIVGTTGQT